MTGASLGYSGNYTDMSLNNIGAHGGWWSSIIRDTNNSYNLAMSFNGSINLNNTNTKRTGRAVRHRTTQIISKAFTVTTRFKQVSTKYIQIVTSATTIGIRRPIISMC
ncbi:hypothetical protein IKE88_03375 [Candidatus Saccharibacteria bacterium]|nr:hypothetical protein [Candidatus Saccharibacteria bacterium]